MPSASTTKAGTRGMDLTTPDAYFGDQGLGPRCVRHAAVTFLRMGQPLLLSALGRPKRAAAAAAVAGAAVCFPSAVVALESVAG